MDKDLENFKPDFSVADPGDRCIVGGGHEYVEEYTDDNVQVLTCTKCKMSSVGYFKGNN